MAENSVIQGLIQTCSDKVGIDETLQTSKELNVENADEMSNLQ